MSQDGKLSKEASLKAFQAGPGELLNTDQGIPVADNQNSLRAGARGPTLLEDFILREKITHFDHERIPERVVHARGAGAHGYFEVYKPMARYTRAKFLQDPAVKTPVFVRFSTVGGSRGSADTVRDVRGFATKFYTEEGNFDLVGNNMPVFFVQDAVKFPDFVHAVKPEPDNEIPQASSAHDTFWDFISLVPESTHMVMWLMSDRAIPRSFSMMEGFGVHTFRFVNSRGKSRFVKFHWKPLLGVHSLVWDEAQKLAGKDPDFNRRDLWESIEMGNYPEFELGVQMLEEGEETKLDFDILDATKIWPEERVPVARIGKLTLNRNPDNFFAETEQIAFCPANVVPGIDFSDDPLLQGRLFSYLDTQLTRLGGPNFAEIPINRPVVPVSNNHRDGFMRQAINPGRANYEPNSLAGGLPRQAGISGYVSYPESIEARKVRERSATFSDHFSQATLFWNSMSLPEKQHIVDAFRFELSKVETKEIRERMVGQLARVDADLAAKVAEGIGATAPMARRRPAMIGAAQVGISRALSMANAAKGNIKGRRVAVLAADGVDSMAISALKKALEAGRAHVDVVSTTLGGIKAADGRQVLVDKPLFSAESVVFDAVFVPGGKQSVAALMQTGDAVQFVAEAFKHCKPIGATGEGVDLLMKANIPGLTAANGSSRRVPMQPGVITGRDGSEAETVAKLFVEAVGQHRFWNRQKEQVMA